MSKTLATILVLAATSTAAMAAPYHTPVSRPAAAARTFHRPIDGHAGRVQGRGVEQRWRPVVRSHGWEPIVHPVYVAPAPIAPVYGSAFVNGQQWLSLGGATGTAIELTANGGSSFVQQITLQYANGTTQVVPIGRELYAGSPALTIPTDGCALSGVSVIGWGSGVSAYAL